MTLRTSFARRVEQICGALAGALTLIAITVGALIPVSSSTFSVHEGNRLVQYAHTTTSLFQFLGAGLAGSLISAFVAFGIVFAATSILHAHEANPVQAHGMLAFEWVTGALLVLLAWVTSILFVFLFIPAVGLVAATLLVSTSRHFTAARA